MYSITSRTANTPGGHAHLARGEVWIRRHRLLCSNPRLAGDKEVRDQVPVPLTTMEEMDLFEQRLKDPANILMKKSVMSFFVLRISRKAD
ncbi:hypothetical protein EYF80_057645 [Liparis tanakae]|uniref:Uncharacterized protein n=1 Tax=Liparis tanakae TaxID=230148 RepID=A0A4Z2ETF2_9TELE|nr:hypothetical protein EYF80_057645 [Liparis tanakae]